MPKKYGINIVEPGTDNTSSEIEKMFEDTKDSKNESHDSDVKKHTALVQENMKEVRIFSQRK